MSKTKLTYFNLTGLGEPIRLMLAYGNIEYEDCRVSRQEWAAMKPSLAWPHLPMLEIDGKTLFHSMAICRYLAKRMNLSGGNSDWLNVQIDMTVDSLNDFRAKVVGYYYLPDSEERERRKAAVIVDILPVYLDRFEKQVSTNKGYLVAEQLTWADIIFLSFIEYISYMLDKPLLEKHPMLKEYHQRLKSLPGIEEWLKTRPPNPDDARVLFS
ncbi:hypothetical protein O3M35_008695 [Rhynocoris fuscipes]|uniref:glutathione transferase n=1 Tax=Rhynocoris fuscipes TaxID=488301 RepID=A0AAW1D774_9HEMI